MSYIDGFFDRNADTIRVVERKDGKRVFKEFPVRYTFYYEDGKGKYKSTTGKPLHRVVCKNTKDFDGTLSILLTSELLNLVKSHFDIPNISIEWI